MDDVGITRDFGAMNKLLCGGEGAEWGYLAWFDWYALTNLEGGFGALMTFVDDWDGP